jgi:hypothetical protein
VIPVGYMAKHICNKPDCFHAPQVVDIYSVSSHMNDNFAADYINLWKHNGCWLFDSPEIIRNTASREPHQSSWNIALLLRSL